MERLTKRQAAIIGAFTGVTCGPFVDIQEYADEVLGFATFTHQFGDKSKRSRPERFLGYL